MEKTIGQKIKEKRLENDFTMKELAERCGVQTSAVNKWEKDMIVSMPIETMRKISKALNCDISYFVDEDSDHYQRQMGMIERNLDVLDTNSLDRVIAYANYLKIKKKETPQRED